MTRLFTSTVGKKFVMAVTGAALFLFVVGHMVGNLQFFLGAEALNRYGHFLQSNVELLWTARIGLLVMVALHVWSASALARANRAARPVQYANWKPNSASYASRTMVMSGLIIMAFIIFHLLHYTVKVPAVNLTGKDFNTMTETLTGDSTRHDIYEMMVLGFSQPLVSGFYILAVGLLCLHLSHGVSAMFQSLGLKNHNYGPYLDRAAKLIAIVLFLGYIAIPVAVLLTKCGGCCP
jgi:succinate dehydrogenase / fumarate reductase cytochrome b subunit